MKIKEEIEREVIELYEKVATMQITPNQARKEFMDLLNKEIDAAIKQHDRVKAICDSVNNLSGGY